MPTWTSENLNTLAVETGFDVCRVTSVAEAWAASDRLREFVSSGYHGQMGWMEDTLERRVHPRAMWEGARSAVVLGLNYGPDHDPLSVLEQKSQAAISVYAKGKDYHDVLKKRLKRFARAFAEATGEEVKVFVDTAPLMEKPLAGQTYQSGQPGVRVMALFGGDADDGRAGARPERGGPLRLMPGLSRYLSDPRFSRAL